MFDGAPVTRRPSLSPPFASAAHPTDSADPTHLPSTRALRAHWGQLMPILVLAALAALGLSAREISVSHRQHDVMTQAQARYIAVHDPACQDSLRAATTDSARATIVDACTQRVIENGMRSITKRVADSK